MKKIVTKFGGSSLADAGQFRKVKDILLLDEARQYVIPSAPGRRFKDDDKVTDLLYRCHKQKSAGEDYQDTFDLIAARYMDIAEELGLHVDLGAALDEVNEKIDAGANADYCASRGEYLNGLLLADFMGWRFMDAAEAVKFTADGAFDAETTNTLMAEKLSDGVPTVVPGFYGSYPDGTIKTFSRGGSDITGAIVARAVEASVYENWTDVSGFLMADPRIVPHPREISSITYKELRELSYMGASVLHEDAMFPVHKAGIPTNIRNTNDPSHPGTIISLNAPHDDLHPTITGIAGRKGFSVISIEKAMMNSELGFGRRMLEALEECNVSFEHMPSGIDTMTVFVHQSEFEEKEQKVLSGIHRAVSPDSIELESDLALIAVVGRGMRSNRGTAGRIFSALSHANVNVKMIDQGSSELNIIIGVKNEDFEPAIQAIYNIFVMTRL